MFNCILNEKRICSLDIKHDLELKKAWKKASKSESLICEECGGIVFLRAGEIYTPYFAHKKDSGDPICYYRVYDFSKDKLKTISLVYDYFKFYFSDKEIVETFYRRDEKTEWDLYLVKRKRSYKFINLRFRNDVDKLIQEYDKKGILSPKFIFYGKKILESNLINKESWYLNLYSVVLESQDPDELLRVIDIEKEELYKFDVRNFPLSYKTISLRR